MLTSPVSIMFSEMVMFFVHLDTHWVSQEKTFKKILRSLHMLRPSAMGIGRRPALNSTRMDPYCGKAGALLITKKPWPMFPFCICKYLTKQTLLPYLRGTLQNHNVPVGYLVDFVLCWGKCRSHCGACYLEYLINAWSFGNPPEGQIWE